MFRNFSLRNQVTPKDVRVLMVFFTFCVETIVVSQIPFAMDNNKEPKDVRGYIHLV